ncbi:hypothetical protein D9M69_614650 [compost metagenome]
MSGYTEGGHANGSVTKTRHTGAITIESIRTIPHYIHQKVQPLDQLYVLPVARYPGYGIATGTAVRTGPFFCC